MRRRPPLRDEIPLVVRMQAHVVSAQESGPDAFFSLGARKL